MSGFDPVEFLERAVRIPSHEDVTEMRAFLRDELDARGEDVAVDDAGNLLATKGGDGDASHGDDEDRHLVLNTHIDTVTPHVPFSRGGGDGDEGDADEGEDVIRGRGACDAKGPLAGLLAAFLATDPGDDTLTLAVTPDEETLSTGAAALDLDADCYVVGEPTGLDVCTAAKGRFEGTVTLSGVNAHAAEPDSGVNAVAGLESALGALRTFDAGRDPHPQLGGSTLTPTVVAGGDATNQVPAECRLTLDRRSVPPETADGFESELAAHLRAAVPDDVGVDFSLVDRPTPFLEAWDTDPEGELARTVATAAREATDGDAGETRPFTAATEASYFSPAPVVVFGPGVLADETGAVAHSEREYVRVSEVRRAADALVDAVGSLVG